MDEVTDKIGSTVPFIIRLEGDEMMTHYIYIEKELLVETHGILPNVALLMASYYTFDIKYPPFLKLVYLFIQHFLFNIKEQKLPIAVNEVCTGMMKLESDN